MTIKLWAAKRDANEREILRALDRMKVWYVIAPPLDLWILHAGRWIPVEIKNGRNGLRPSQVAFMDRCAREGVPCSLWRSLNDALATLGHA